MSQTERSFVPSPFIICSKFLYQLLLHQEQKGNLHGIKVDHNAPAISHLMYADDLLVMCSANEKNMRLLKIAQMSIVLGWPRDKPSIIFSKKKNTNSRANRNIKAQMDLKEMEKQSIYLGNSLILGRNISKDFHKLKENVQNMFQGWKAQTLLKATKASRIKSVAQTILTYVMSTFLLSKRIAS